MKPKIPMPSILASWLVTIGQICGAVGLLLLDEELPYGLDGYDLGRALIIAGQVSSIIVVALRNNLIPRTESGRALEPPKE